MAYILLLTGLILMLISSRFAFRTIQTSTFDPIEVKSSEDTVNAGHEKISGKVYEDLGDKIELLSLAVERLTSQIANEPKEEHSPDEFPQVFASQEKLNVFQDIYAAYDTGMGVTEIAREYNRGKGEIELILSLRKSSPSL